MPRTARTICWLKAARFRICSEPTDFWFRVGFADAEHRPGTPRGVELILTRSVSFEVALFKTGKYQRGENKGNYHNPTRQRGIFANTAEAKKRNPSLTRRVGIGTNAQLQKA